MTTKTKARTPQHWFRGLPESGILPVAGREWEQLAAEVMEHREAINAAVQRMRELDATMYERSHDNWAHDEISQAVTDTYAALPAVFRPACP